MLEFIFEILGEFLIQMLLEGLVELGFHSVVAPFRKPVHPILAALGYALLGGLLGGASLIVFPSHMVGTHGLRIMALVVVPVLVGGMMVLIGMWRAKRGQTINRLDRFGFGYVFALSMGLTRYLWAQ
jgi:drug/metabolite transporter (DMT)-like permease